MSDTTGKFKGNRTFRRFRSEDPDSAQQKVTLGPSERTEPAKGSISATVGKFLEMTDAEFEALRARPNLTKRERVAIKMIERAEEISLRGGPQILAELLDRQEGKVVVEHRLRGTGDKSGWSDDQITAAWLRRQSRAQKEKTPPPLPS